MSPSGAPGICRGFLTTLSQDSLWNLTQVVGMSRVSVSQRCSGPPSCAPGGQFSSSGYKLFLQNLPRHHQKFGGWNPQLSNLDFLRLRAPSCHMSTAQAPKVLQLYFNIFVPQQERVRAPLTFLLANASKKKKPLFFCLLHNHGARCWGHSGDRSERVTARA